MKIYRISRELNSGNVTFSPKVDDFLLTSNNADFLEHEEINHECDCKKLVKYQLK